MANFCFHIKNHKVKHLSNAYINYFNELMEERRNYDLSFKLRLFVYYGFVLYCILPLFRLFIDKKTYIRQVAEYKESFLSQKWNFQRQKVLNSGLSYHKTSIALMENRLIYRDFEPCEHNTEEAKNV